MNQKILKLAAFFVITSFIASDFSKAACAFTIDELPVPGTIVRPSPAFVPITLKGMKIDVDNPFKIDFILDAGSTKKGKLSRDAVRLETDRLVKYFLTALTIPEKDLWVNLSPYEQDRMIPPSVGATELGADLLAQDYVLKQLTASMIYPKSKIGQKFWKAVYSKVKSKIGTDQIPVNTFNKVWIVPQEARIYEHEHGVYVTKSTLKVMLDEDYLAMSKREAGPVTGLMPSSSQHPSPSGVANRKRMTPAAAVKGINPVPPAIIRDIIVPIIEQEINEGQNFATLRQIYQSLILAKWYRQTVKNTLFEGLLIDKSKIEGLEQSDQAVNRQIYERYLQAYKKGVFNFVEDEMLGDKKVSRKYFSGGITNLTLVTFKKEESNESISPYAPGFLAQLNLVPQTNNAAGEMRNPVALSDTVRRFYDRIKPRIDYAMLFDSGDFKIDVMKMLLAFLFFIEAFDRLDKFRIDSHKEKEIRRLMPNFPDIFRQKRDHEILQFIKEFLKDFVVASDNPRERLYISPAMAAEDVLYKEYYDPDVLSVLLYALRSQEMKPYAGRVTRILVELLQDEGTYKEMGMGIAKTLIIMGLYEHRDVLERIIERTPSKIKRLNPFNKGLLSAVISFKEEGMDFSFTVQHEVMQTVINSTGKKVKQIVAIEEIWIKEEEFEVDEDDALLSAKQLDYGGVDFNDIQINRQAKPIVIRFNPQIAQSLIQQGINGFLPVIESVVPIHNPRPILGLHNEYYSSI